MNIKSRIALHLVMWLVLVGLILFVLAGLTLYWTLEEMSKAQSSREFESVGLQRLIQTIEVEGENVRFDPKLLEKVRDSGGWLQRIDEKGYVTDSFFTPPDVPSYYGPGQLTAYWLRKSPFPYQLSLWIQEKDGVVHTLLYGMTNRDDDFLQQVIEEADHKNNEIMLPPSIQNQLKSKAGWVQLLDPKGTELASFNKPEKAIKDFSLEELALRSVYPDRYGATIVSHYDQNSGQTWVLSYPLPGMTPGEKPLLTPESKALFIGMGMLLLSAMLVFGIVSYLFGQRFGAPIVHVLRWLTLLRGGRYEEPANSDGVPFSQDKRGKRKRKYRIYQDVIDSMDSLSQTLYRNEKLRQETEQLRNEWIAGVSHDLKTPLSSVKGYAHLLGNAEYTWTTEEVHTFAKIILDKSAYMEDLINDLALTYRLRNGQGAPTVELVDLNVCTADAITEAAKHPFYPEGCIQFTPSAEPVYMLLYKPWFQRIVDNLVANALIHNENGTIVSISVQAVEPSTALLIFSDNGSGMDEETADRLFERYYRGTDTESRTEGSGLGMVITKALVEAFGGSIEVKTTIGQGTTISITWEAEQPPRV
ncbi:HAMP domain-containing sensor histidine kinase [Brevibacillus formosus]|uniref:histidine kinase n=1 Tax=Brevibacillus formosus TaxID=54913 RepID=A0A837KG36_9BACL|nr:HAMP domain-containing sensor histidine kinase [Brevibacillus formosus]KLH96278.1 histidine kinase [Brevibacillus formosus]MED1959085.1 HAMP domain-containing sensor histidine kinase [Brevibacillus formosus]PSJ90989.1 sensor histidine kinase [Brevibacillus formosus]GED59836.1 two-component sensor histidine kinase [Brevibacillus formosus]